MNIAVRKVQRRAAPRERAGARRTADEDMRRAVPTIVRALFSTGIAARQGRQCYPLSQSDFHLLCSSRNNYGLKNLNGREELHGARMARRTESSGSVDDLSACDYRFTSSATEEEGEDDDALAGTTPHIPDADEEYVEMTTRALRRVRIVANPLLRVERHRRRRLQCKALGRLVAYSRSFDLLVEQRRLLWIYQRRRRRNVARAALAAWRDVVNTLRAQRHSLGLLLRRRARAAAACACSRWRARAVRGTRLASALRSICVQSPRARRLREALGRLRSASAFTHELANEYSEREAQSTDENERAIAFMLRRLQATRHELGAVIGAKERAACNEIEKLEQLATSEIARVRAAHVAMQLQLDASEDARSELERRVRDLREELARSRRAHEAQRTLHEVNISARSRIAESAEAAVQQTRQKQDALRVAAEARDRAHADALLIARHRLATGATERAALQSKLDELEATHARAMAAHAQLFERGSAQWRSERNEFQRAGGGGAEELELTRSLASALALALETVGAAKKRATSKQLSRSGRPRHHGGSRRREEPAARLEFDPLW